MKSYSRKLISSSVVVVLAIAASVAATRDAGGEPDWEVIDCAKTRTTVLGRSGYHGILVVNTGSTPITVFEPAPPGGWGLASGEMSGRERVHAPSRRSEKLLDHFILKPGEMAGFTVPIPLRSNHPGIFEYTLDLCIVGKEIGPREFWKWLRSDDSSRAEAATSPVVQGCTFFGGEIMKLGGEVSIFEPTGKDKAYYEAYLKKWVETGDLSVKEELRDKRRRRRKELLEKEGQKDLTQLPFSQVRQLPSFKELEDNRYAAMAGYGGGRKIKLLEEVHSLGKMCPGCVKYQYSPSMLKTLESSFDRAQYFVRAYDLQWQAYLARAVDLLGSSEEQRALAAIHEIASSSPDCVARYLAKRVLEVYSEVKEGKR